MSAVAQEMQGTHQDRPTPKRMLPFRVIPWHIGGRTMQALEYDTVVPLPRLTTDLQFSEKKNTNGKLETVFHQTQLAAQSRKVPRIIVIEDPVEGCLVDPLGYHIKSVMDVFWGEEAKVDGLLSKVDQLTTDKVMLQKDVDRLTSQNAELQRQIQNLKKSK